MSLGRILASVLIGFVIWVGTVAWGDWLDRLFGSEP